MREGVPECKYSSKLEVLLFCNYCGATLNAQQAVCPACGKPATAGAAGVPASPPAPFPPPVRSERERLASHLRLLAILWFIVAFLWLIPAVGLFVASSVVHNFIPTDEPGAAFARALGPLVITIIAGLVLLISALCFAAGWGLLKVRPWARMLAIVLGAISLIHPPFGTALGVYTLWVLLGGNAAAEYERMTTSTN
jgi:hypothetical protein